MPFKFQLRNALGEDILDQRKALYVQQSGETSLAAAVPQPFSGGEEQQLPIRQITDGSTVELIGTDGSGFLTQVPAPLWPKTAMAFYRPALPEGLCFSLEHYVGPTYIADATPSQGLIFRSANANNSAISYFVADIALGPVQPGYKVELRNAANEVTFDSRAGLFSIAEVPFVTQATIGDVLDNGATHDITLSKAMPGCYISVPYLSAFKYRPGANPTVHWRPRIRQVSDTVLRIDRVQVGAPFNTTLRPRYVHDFAIFVARDPFA